MWEESNKTNTSQKLSYLLLTRISFLYKERLKCMTCLRYLAACSGEQVFFTLNYVMSRAPKANTSIITSGHLPNSISKEERLRLYLLAALRTRCLFFFSLASHFLFVPFLSSLHFFFKRCTSFFFFTIWGLLNKTIQANIVKSWGNAVPKHTSHCNMLEYKYTEIKHGGEEQLS